MTDQPSDPSNKSGGEATRALREKAQGLGETHHQIAVTIPSTKRHFILSYPDKMTDSEIVEIVGYLTVVLRTQLRQPSLIIPRPSLMPDA